MDPKERLKLFQDFPLLYPDPDDLKTFSETVAFEQHAGVVSEDSEEQHTTLGVRIVPLSAEEMRQTSSGEVQTHRIFSSNKKCFHLDGLFSEGIFGPVSDWSQTNTGSPMQFGHIELPVPIFHPLFRDGLAGQAVCAVLGLTETELDQLLKGWTCVVTEELESGLSCGAVVTVEAYETAAERYGSGLRAEYQAEAVRWLLRRATLDASIARAKVDSPDNSGIVRLIRRWFENGHGLDRLVLDVLPVIPPAMRPMQRTAQGSLRRHDLTCLYQKLLRRCARIRKLTKLDAPPVILRNEARLLHEAVERLLVKPSQANDFDPNSRRLKPLLQSLQDSLTPLHEEGRTKTWKNSLRLPAAPNPRLPITQCGLPRTAATLEMLSSIWFSHCTQSGRDPRFAERQLRHPTASVWEVIESKLPRHAVLVSHEARRSRASLQAFQPMLVEGRAIQLSPLALNALRDGSIQEDVSVFLLQSPSACSQALVEMLPDQCRNPASGKFAYKPTLDMILGCSLMTRDPLPISEDFPCKPRQFECIAFRTVADVQCAWDHGVVSLNTPIQFYLNRRTIAEQPLWEKVCDHRQRIDTTPGRVIFNDLFPLDLPFVNYSVTENSLGDHLESAHAIIGATRTRQLLEALQAIAIAALTQSGLSISLSDLAPPPKKAAILDEAHKQVAKLRRLYDRGIISPSERLNQTYDAWNTASSSLTQEVAQRVYAASTNPASLFTAVARSSGRMTWVRHYCGMFGFIVQRDGRIHETPVTSNWGEGLGVADYFQVVRLSRCATVNEFQRIEWVEPLTRSLLEALKVVSVTVADCGTTDGIEMSGSAEASLPDVLLDRVSCETIINPIDGEQIVGAGEWITEKIAQGMASLNVPKLRVRSPATCDAEHGICQQCYGRNNSTGELFDIGTEVGVIAAFAIGELAHNMNWYHTRQYRAPQIGWVYGTEEADYSGTIQFQLSKTVRRSDGCNVAMKPGKILIRDRMNFKLQEITVPIGANLLISDGAVVRRGDEICTWNTNGIPLLADCEGTVKLCGFVLGDNCRGPDESDTTNYVTMLPPRWSSRSNALRPHIIILDADGQPIEAHFLADYSEVQVTDGQMVVPGDMLALQRNRLSFLDDLASEVKTAFGSDLQDLLEAGPARETTVLAPFDSVVFSIERNEKHRKLVLQREDGEECEIALPRDSYLRVGVGDAVTAGDPLTHSSQVNPNDVFSILGVEAGIQHVLGRLSRLFVRNQISIDSRHMELVIGRMLSRVKIEHPGDTDFIAGEVIDLNEWRRENDRVRQFVRIASCETPEFTVGQLVLRETLELLVRELTSQSKPPPTVRRAHARLAHAALHMTSILRLAKPPKSDQLSGDFDVDVLARFALTGEVNSINRLTDLILLKLVGSK